MKNILFTLIVITFSQQFYAQDLIATAQLKEPVEGVCDNDKVYALFPMFGDQVEAVAPFTEAELQEMINNALQFLKDNPKFKDKGMINILINCEGEVVRCILDNSKKNDPEFEKQLKELILSKGVWKAGKLNGKDVDSIQLISYKIKKGVITLE